MEDAMKLEVFLSVLYLLCIVGMTKAEEMNNNCSCGQVSKPHVYKKILGNGLTVLVRPIHSLPKVCTELWYKVGSKNEKTDQKGLAHLIEHMVFKGTKGNNSLNLSESDINTVVHKLSGNCNAFTSYDYTGYLFNFPTQHWTMALKIVADCMRNCAFKEDHLNSEMKAVVQELKMYKDNYVSYLVDEMLAAIFVGHPYHDPVIGYKHNLWSFHAQNLRDFYVQHYVPNNATLVVVGDVDPEQVFEQAQQEIGSIPADYGYIHESFYFMPDIISKKITLYRDIQQPIATSVYVIPGSQVGQDCIIDVLSWVLGHGRCSRLQRRLVDELQLVTSLDVYHVDLFEYGLVGVLFEPKNVDNISAINNIIQQEIDDIITHGFKEGELERAVKNAKVRLYDTFEDFQQQATEIGKYYLATGNKDYIFTYLDNPLEDIRQKILVLCKQYLRASVMHEGIVLPLTEKDKNFWTALQEEADAQDLRILSSRERKSLVEDPHFALQVKIEDPQAFIFPKSKRFTLPNNATILYACNDAIPKIDLVIDFKAKYYYDPDNLQGLSNFMNRVLLEGTKNYPGNALADVLEARGINIKAFPGGIAMSMLKDDFEYGLELLHEILINASFELSAIEKVREQLLADVKSFWDEPTSFAGQLIKNVVYKGHPYSKDALGTAETIATITRQDLIDCYKKTISPDDMRMAIVGDIGCYDVEKIVTEKLGNWQGSSIATIQFPALQQIKEHNINYQINRDQVVLCLASSSVSRLDQDFDKLYLFDQIFGSGVLGSMSSRLFQLREQSGLFYTIQGSVTVQSNDQPGMAMVKTIVSLDRLAEAEKVIKNTIDTVPDSIQPIELEEAKRAVLNALISNFETNFGAAKSFIFLERYDFPSDYFDKRGSMLEPITVEQVRDAAKKVLCSDRMVTLRIGRVKKEGF
jgi:zinc protease